MIIISDTSPICYLILIKAIDILPKLYGKVIITQGVYEELGAKGAPPIVRQWLENIPTWLKIESVSFPINDYLKDLDRGESEAIFLAEKLKADLIIIDEQTARNIAKNRGLVVIGILGVLYQAALQNLINLEEAINSLKSTNFRASNQLLVSLIIRYQQEVKFKQKNMITVTEAAEKILDLITPLKETETLSLNNNFNASLNRILAEDIKSNLDFPHWDNSAMDGYAVKFEDVKNARENNPITLKIVEEIPAGYAPKITIKNGEAARIFTGAMLPLGADTIVIQENTIKEKNEVKILISPPKIGDFIRKKGEFYQAKNPLLKAGISLKPAEIAVLAAANCEQVTVYRRPKIAIFSTGDELVPLGKSMKTGQIIDSNQYAIASFIASNDAIPIQLGIVKDDQQALRETIAHAITIADMVISTGGVSVGEYDYIDDILGELGAKIEITSVLVKPGKPLTVAKFPRCVYFGIPGNPVSALVSCWRFVQPAIKKLSGIKNNWQPIFINAKCKENLKSNGQRETYLWGQLIIENGENCFHLAGGSHSSGNLINLAETNALAMIPVGTKLIEKGEIIKIMVI